jgi:hypothetical protein
MQKEQASELKKLKSTATHAPNPINLVGWLEMASID